MNDTGLVGGLVYKMKGQLQSSVQRLERKEEQAKYSSPRQWRRARSAALRSAKNVDTK